MDYKTEDYNDDWTNSYDDLDGDNWGNYMGGPDNDEFEKYEEERQETSDDMLNYIEDEKDIMDECDEAEYMRREEIIDWLSKSSLVRKFRYRDGFIVSKGIQVRLMGGTIVDIMEWLNDESISGGAEIAGYSVVYSKGGLGFGENLSFFKIVMDVPFIPIQKDELEEYDREIPF